MALPDVGLINYEDVPNLDAATPVGANWLFLARDPTTNNVFEVLLSQLATSLNPTSSLTVVAAPTFTNFDDTANVVTLVAVSGVPMADYRYQIGSSGAFQPVPLTGIIDVGNATGRVYAYSVATATRAQSAIGQTADRFTITVGLPIGAPPSFTGIDDVANLVTLIAGLNQQPSDYLYKITGTGTYAYCPADGIINVGNITGQVFAYLPATALRAVSQTIASESFLATVSALPSVHFLTPGAGTSVALNVQIPLTATATDLAGIFKVEFFAGARPLGDGASNNGSYSVLYTPLAIDGPQPYLYAKATNTNGGQSTASTVVMVQAAATAPGAPTNARGTVYADYIQATWSAPLQTGGSPILGYEIYKANTTTLLGTTAAGDLFYNDYSAVIGADTSYQVLARNLVGPGALSTASTAVKLAAPVVTYSYTTTGTDFTAKCGAGTNPGPQMRTSTVSQADAMAQAIAAIVCPVALTYDTSLTGPGPVTPAAGQPGVGVQLATGGGADVFRFNNITGGTTLPQTMGLFIGSTQVAAVDFPDAYLGKPFSYTPAGGTLRTGTFTNGNVTI